MNLHQVSLFQDVLRVNKVNGVSQRVLVPTYFTIASTVAVEVQVFNVRSVANILNRVDQVPDLIRSQFPRPSQEVIAITTRSVTSVTVRALYGFKHIVPRLPTKHVSSRRRTRLVTNIRGDQVLQAIDVASSLRPSVFRFLNVPPVGAVYSDISSGHGVLITIDSSRQFTMQSTVRMRTIFPFGLGTTSSSATTMAISRVSFLVGCPRRRIVRNQYQENPGRQLLRQRPIKGDGYPAHLRLCLIARPNSFNTVQLRRRVFRPTKGEVLHDVTRVCLWLGFHRNVQGLSRDSRRTTSYCLIFVV